MFYAQRSTFNPPSQRYDAAGFQLRKLSRARRPIFKILGFAPILFGFIINLSAQFTPALLQNDSYWGDGKAEFDLYDAQIMREGQARHCEVLHIFVRDTIEPKQSLSERRAPFAVIRMNQILDVPIGIGVQHQSLSLFWSSDGRLAQLSFVGADSIGNIYKTCTNSPDANALSYECHSYRDGITRQALARSAGDAILYDELPLRIRTINFSKATGEFDIQLAPTTISARSDNIVFKPAKVSFKPGERAINVDVQHDAGSDHFVLDRDFPFLLREWNAADGSRFKLKNSLKVDYWNYSKNGDRERALKDPMLRHPD
jgi:hypothetical protein